MLLRKRKITGELILIVDGWRHSGFSVFCGERIHPREKRSVENLAAYLIMASFSQERMKYFPEAVKVVYHSKDGDDKRTYDPLEWIAAMGTHVPLRGEQMVSIMQCSNCSRGRRLIKETPKELQVVCDYFRGKLNTLLST